MFKTLKLKNKEERYSRVPRLSDTNSSMRGSIPFVPNLIINKEERYSRVPRLSDTQVNNKKTRKNAIVEYLDYQIP